MGKKKGGKPATGRAKQRQKTAPNSSPWIRAANDVSYDEEDDAYITFKGFGGQTQRRFAPADPSVKLRHKGITFVSASTNPPKESTSETNTLKEARPSVESTADGSEQLIAAIQLDDDDHDEVDADHDETISKEITDIKIVGGFDGAQDVEEVAGKQHKIPPHRRPKVETPATNKQSELEEQGFVIDTVGDENLVPAKQRAKQTFRVVGDKVEEQFVIDLVGDPSLVSSQKQTNSESIAMRSASPARSESSDEEIIFKGRGNIQSSERATPRIVDDPPKLCTWAAKPSQSTLTQQSASQTWEPAPQGAWWREKQNTADKNQNASMQEVDNDQTMVDAAANTSAELKAAWNQTRKEKKEAKKLAKQEKKSARKAENEIASQAAVNRRGKRGRRRDNRLLRAIENEFDDENDGEAAARGSVLADSLFESGDEDDLAVKDYVDNLLQQKLADAGSDDSAEEDSTKIVDAEIADVVDVDELNPAEAQDIVNADEAAWEDMDTDGDEDSSDIGKDLSDFLDDKDDELNASDLDSSDLEDEIDNAAREWHLAQDALTKHRINHMSDEQIARLMQKQYELGIDGDELLIDDGEVLDGQEDAFGDLEFARTKFAEYSNLPASRRKKSKGKGKQRDMTFPDATALADSIDQYGNEGFDIMDYDRPSLRNTKKGRKGRLPPELEALSDDDLRETMLASWDNDREKKRVKKAEREVLRAEGLIGGKSKNGKADLSQKYLLGMTMDQVHIELRLFLDDDGATTRAFPPMHKADRQALHNICNHLNLKSKSVGSGNNRFPVLYKTQNTGDFNEAAFSRAIRASSRGFLRNSSSKGKKAGRVMSRATGGATGAASIRHGEAVGAGAKELGKENFGHKLMMKMGWTEGTALGKDGDGLLKPVEQIMRTGRAGLG